MHHGRHTPRGGEDYHDASDDAATPRSIAESDVPPLPILDPRLRRALVRYHKRDEQRACWRDTQNVRLLALMVLFVVVVSVGAGIFHSMEGHDMDVTHDNATSFVSRMKLRLNGSEYVYLRREGGEKGE